MKILMISVRSDIGGGPKHVYDLVRTIKSMSDMSVYIAAPDCEPYGELFNKVADGFIEIPFRKFSIYSFLKLLIHCKKNKVELIHSHGRGGGIYSRLLGLFGFKVIHTFHGAHFTSNLLGHLKSVVDRILKKITDEFICVSYDEKKKVTEFSWADGSKVNVVLNGIDHININKEFKGQNREGSPLVLGTLARFNYQKGLDIFLKMLKDNKYYFFENKISFKIAGNGEDFNELNDYRIKHDLDELVFFVGATNNPIGFLSKLDIYFSFARWEGLPLSVLEAMSCPLPCVLSDVVGHNELKKDNECLLFNLENPKDFLMKVEILNDPIKRSEIASNSFKMISEMYTLENMVKNTLSVYSKIT